MGSFLSMWPNVGEYLLVGRGAMPRSQKGGELCHWPRSLFLSARVFGALVLFC